MMKHASVRFQVQVHLRSLTCARAQGPRPPPCQRPAAIDSDSDASASAAAGPGPGQARPGSLLGRHEEGGVTPPASCPESRTMWHSGKRRGAREPADQTGRPGSHDGGGCQRASSGSRALLPRSIRPAWHPRKLRSDNHIVSPARMHRAVPFHGQNPPK